ncbi:Flagellar biosynthesis protein FliQ [Leptospirillum ferriphilum]|uniref:Flagellar biosynthetic protein FliQ n=3 Tax=Leptospirillum TaxID=179 RepID=A0A094WER4_9BACT|nr:flagellar biosynthesis protein FliQ [Leptospirillum ferriphilum]EDZ39621.1 MAG: flagellar biosynthesis protein FliQ [Leptospirillum sp. Group II '5-way CG']EIJ76503.1 MAG: Chemotaxis/flagellar protein [Leptospirillum sp. Group II 'C75']KGA95010.1 Flagellar biosynthesis protein FliQ [Leptospirillum ferriphilum]
MPLALFWRERDSREEYIGKEHRFMNVQTAIDLTHNALVMALILTLPVLVVSLVIGVLVSLFQAVTQINETTLSFLPKVAGVVGVLLVLMPWMVRQLIDYTATLFRELPGVVR